MASDIGTTPRPSQAFNPAAVGAMAGVNITSGTAVLNSLTAPTILVVAPSFDPTVTGLAAPVGARATTTDGAHAWDKITTANTGWYPVPYYDFRTALCLQAAVALGISPANLRFFLEDFDLLTGIGSEIANWGDTHGNRADYTTNQAASHLVVGPANQSDYSIFQRYALLPLAVGRSVPTWFGFRAHLITEANANSAAAIQFYSAALGVGYWHWISATNYIVYAEDARITPTNAPTSYVDSGISAVDGADHIWTFKLPADGTFMWAVDGGTWSSPRTMPQSTLDQLTSTFSIQVSNGTVSRQGYDALSIDWLAVANQRI